METENGESLVVRVALLDFLLIETYLVGVTSLHPVHLKEYLPPFSADECVQQESRTVLPPAWSASHPNDGEAVVETWATAADALQAHPESKPGVYHSRTEDEFGMGALVFSPPRALRGQRAGHNDADSRGRPHARIHGVAVVIAGGGRRGIRGA